MSLDNLADDLLTSIERTAFCCSEFNNPEIRMNSFTIEFIYLYLNTLYGVYGLNFDKSKTLYIYGINVVEDSTIHSMNFNIKDRIKGE